MKPNLNPKYIKYKVVFITSAYFQEISEKAIELFIIKDNLNIFPGFIHYHAIDTVNKNYLNKVVIDIKRITCIINNMLYYF